MRVTVVTLNTWGLPWPVAPDTATRMRLIGERLESLDADVFAFQEVWSDESRETLIRSGARTGHHHVWHRKVARGGSGLLVLSRLPIAESHFTPFLLNGLPQRLNHADWYGGKGVVRLTLETPVGPLCFVDTHLHASYGKVGAADEYRGHRVAQVIEIASLLAGVDAPVLVAGDLNAEDDESEIAILLGLAGLTDAAAELGRREDTVLPLSPYRPDEESPGMRIDYILARSGRTRSLLPRDVERVFDDEFEIDGRRSTYSDHAGVRAVFRLQYGGAPPMPPALEAVAAARTLLDEGRERARERRASERCWAAGTGVSSLALLAAAPRLGGTRRGLVKLALYGLGGLAVAGTGGFVALSERFVPGELADFDRVEGQLDELAASQPG